MGFLELLTLIFVILKAFGVVSFSWWIVFLPLIVALIGYLGLFITFMFFGASITKGFKDK